MEPTTINCSGTCTVALTIEPAPANAQNIEDYNLIYAAFLVALMAIWLIKRLNAILTGDHERG